MDYAQELKSIRKDLKSYVQKSGLKSLILGQSGGIDSALVSAIAKPVCDELNIPLITISITIETNKEEEIERARNMGRLFSTKFYDTDYTKEYLDMKHIYDFESIVKDETDFDKKVRFGNLKARLRMTLIFNIAQLNNGLVLGTDNLDEWYLSYFTRFGDEGDYDIIHHLWKTQIFDIAQFICDEELTEQNKKNALQSCIDATPCDGLGITDNDMDQIGCKDYYECGKVLKTYLETGEILNEKVIKRHLNSQFKRHLPIRKGNDLSWMDN